MIKQKIENKLNMKPEDEKLTELNAKLRKRLLVAIKLLLKENPVLPTGFKYNGICLIEVYRKEEREYINATYDSMKQSQVDVEENDNTGSKFTTGYNTKDLLDENKWIYNIKVKF